MADLVIAPLTLTVVSTAAQIIFTGFEIPQNIPFGGKQALAVHKMVGGKRTVDAMGPDDKPLAWSGRLLGPNALARARFLDYLRTSGQLLHLSWSEMSYMVVMEDFSADFERAYNLPYSISCLVLENNANPITTAAVASLDDAIAADMSSATTLAAQVNDSKLSTLMTTLKTATQAVSSVANAAQSTIASITNPLKDVQNQVNILIGSVGSTVGNIGSLGGLLPGTGIAQQANKFSQQVVSATQLPALYNLQAVTGRMGSNLGMTK